jgi:transposase
MIRPDFAKWGEGPDDMRRLMIEAMHERSRERFQALYMIGTGQTTATQWAQMIGRNERTVMNWIHLYNRAGSAGLHYRHSGGRTPFLAKTSRLRSSPPSRPVSRPSMPSPVMAGR